MDSTIQLVIAGIIGVIICIAIIIIDKIHRKTYNPGSILETQNEDIIDTVTNYKKKKIQSNPWSINYTTYKMIAIIATIALAVFGYVLTRSFFWTLVFAAVGLFIPEFVSSIQGNKQKVEYEERYATGLRQLVAGLKSGMTIQQAVSDVCTSPFVHDSIKDEFKAIDADLKLGIPIRDAFQNFADRVHFQDAQDVAIAITMQEKVGGREAKVIETIAKNISDRLMLRKEVNSLFAGTNATVITMDIVPFAIIALIYLITPSYLSPFFNNIVLTILFIGLLIVMGIGSIYIHNSITNFKKECGL